MTRNLRSPATGVRGGGEPPAAPSLTVGYLHLGPRRGGVARYSGLLAEHARARPDVDVLEVWDTLPDVRTNALRSARRWAVRFATCDVVHLQHSHRIWGGGWFGVVTFLVFLISCRPPTVVTFHDVYDAHHPRSGGSAMLSSQRGVRRFTSGLRPYRMVLALATCWCAATIVSSDVERDRLARLWRITPLVIPHFVESPAVVVDRDSARRSLGISRRYVITIVGFIHERKRHDLLVAALDQLPDDCLVVFAGTANERDKPYLTAVLREAEARGVRDRIVVTDYLADEQLAAWLAATDVGVCPFSRASASGSLSTLVGAGVPVVASDIDVMRWYHRHDPVNVELFEQGSVDDLVRALQRVRARPRSAVASPIARRLYIRHVWQQHHELFEAVRR